MGVTQTAKNLFGSVYFEGNGFTPAPLHDFASRDLPMASYNCLVDLIAYKHLGGKTLLYLIDFLYVAESQNIKVIKYKSFGDHWCSSLFLSQDPVAIDSGGAWTSFATNRARSNAAANQRTICTKRPRRAKPLPESCTTRTAITNQWRAWAFTSTGTTRLKRSTRGTWGKRQGIELSIWPPNAKV